MFGPPLSTLTITEDPRPNGEGPSHLTLIEA